jgi:LacI family transcriptional regulator
MHAPPGSVPGIPTFCADNEGAMRSVVRHLKGLGHQRIAFVVDTINQHTVEGRARCDAFEMAALAAGLAPEVLVWDERCDEVEAYATDDPPHSALVCFSDTLAGWVLAACSRYRVSVPEDVSVIGFDSSSFCDGTRPRLTSVSQPVEHMAFMATKHLLTLIREGATGSSASPTVSSIYDCGLDIRESTGEARRRVRP